MYWTWEKNTPASASTLAIRLVVDALAFKLSSASATVAVAGTDIK